jgi:hypothetical protein
MAAVSIRRLRGPEREAHARTAIRRWAASGSSKAAFCRAEGISPVTFFRWMQEFGSVGQPSASGGFVEVRLDRATAPRGFELEFSSGRRLRIPPGFDAGDLERILALLDPATC